MIGSLLLPGTKAPLRFRVIQTLGLGALISRIPPTPKAMRSVAALLGEGEVIDGHPALIGPDDLGSLSMPTLLMWGDHDPAGSPATARVINQILPEAPVAIIPGGHAPFLDDPAAYADLIAELTHNTTQGDNHDDPDPDNRPSSRRLEQDRPAL